jgi:hypothetical protein
MTRTTVAADVVGREAELAQLREALDAAAAGSSASLAEMPLKWAKAEDAPSEHEQDHDLRRAAVRLPASSRAPVPNGNHGCGAPISGSVDDEHGDWGRLREAGRDRR